MARKPSLRAVSPDEKPARVAPKSLTDAAAVGDTRAMLAAMRARIAKSIEDPNCSTRDLASLSKRLMEVQRDIEALDARDEQEDERAIEVEDGTFDASAV